jgi:hypothetical protein
MLQQFLTKNQPRHSLADLSPCCKSVSTRFRKEIYQRLLVCLIYVTGYSPISFHKFFISPVSLFEPAKITIHQSCSNFGQVMFIYSSKKV